MSALEDHLKSGATTLCRAWILRRKDGVVLGFTDHDQSLEFEGVCFLPQTGFEARAISQTTGLSVDNTEAVGALRAEAISEADLRAGRYDGAEIEIWRVNWQDCSQREVEFRGTLGEVGLAGQSFSVEMRGLAEALNTTRGRVFQRSCSAVLGDARCRVLLDQPAYSLEAQVEIHEGGRIFRFGVIEGYAERWFERGRLEIRSGAAAGLVGMVKNDRVEGAWRVVELWAPMPAAVEVGDLLRLQAGCDRLAETCRAKFDNMANFRGFPHLPSEDWLVAVPKRAAR